MWIIMFLALLSATTFLVNHSQLLNPVKHVRDKIVDLFCSDLVDLRKYVKFIGILNPC